MKKIHCRTILAMSHEDLWKKLHGPFTIVFDDGRELDTNSREALYTSYCWDFFRLYPKTQILFQHYVRHTLNGSRLTADTHLDLLSTCLWSVYDTYSSAGYMAEMQQFLPLTGGWQTIIVPEVTFRESLAKMAYELTNKIYNELSYRCEEYVVSLNIMDFMDVLAHPRVREINNNLQLTSQSVNNAYEVVKHTIRNAEELRDNPLSHAVHSRTVKEDQLMQCITARGPLTDTDSFMFPNPVLRSYSRGLRSIHDLLVESRSAAKSLASSKAQLQDAEYFSRRLQLLTQIVQRLHMADCGTKEYLLYRVRGKEYENGRLMFKGNLDSIHGANYMDDDNVMKVVDKNDKTLIGRQLRLRNVLYCTHPDPYGVCSTCFGQLALSVPSNSNIGHMCCTHMTQKSSQSVLSLKHLDMNSSVDGVVIDGSMRRCVRAAADANSYVLAPELQQADSIKLVVSTDQARGMTDVKDVEDVKYLHITQISDMETIDIYITQGKITEPVTVNVKLNNRNASFTTEMLEYIKMHEPVLSNEGPKQGRYIIDMAEWDWGVPFLTLPMKHYNMSDHSAAIAKMLEATVKEANDRDINTSPASFLMDFHDLVNDKLNVNLAVNSIIVLGITIRSARNFDYRLPKPAAPAGLGVGSNIMAYRSAVPAMMFEGQRDFLLSPMSYVVKAAQRPSHPADFVMMPAEMLEYRRKNPNMGDW